MIKVKEKEVLIVDERGMWYVVLRGVCDNLGSLVLDYLISPQESMISLF